MNEVWGRPGGGAPLMKLKDQMILRKHSGKFESSSFVVYLHASAMTWAFLCVAANQMWHDIYCFMDCFIQSMHIQRYCLIENHTR